MHRASGTAQNSLLSLQDLKVWFRTRRGIVKAADGVSLDLRAGETLGIVGESGSGKSVTCLSILNLIPSGGRIESGKILFENRNLVGLPERDYRRIRGKEIAMVFQDPMTSLNPFQTVGEQVGEPLVIHEHATKGEARRRATEMLERVGIPEPGRRLDEYPHQFSGGMRQRVMIAMALITHPKLLIADEPTTALDVTIQAQVLELFRNLKAERGASIVLVTHNLGIVAGMADRVAVMYAGRVVEYAETGELFSNPRHPYTLALLKAVPRLGDGAGSVAPIPGAPPDLAQLPAGCSFYERCPFRLAKCETDSPPLAPVGENHAASCWVDVSGQK